MQSTCVLKKIIVVCGIITDNVQIMRNLDSRIYGLYESIFRLIWVKILPIKFKPISSVKILVYIYIQRKCTI